MGGKCGQILFNALFISDIRKYLIKYGKLRTLPCRDVKACLTHKGKESHRF